MVEQRKCPRRACLQSCTWSIYGSKEARSSRIINQSPCGMLLETDQALSIGLPVKVVRHAVHGQGEHSEAVCMLGIVCWSAPQPGDMGACHGVGIEIIRVAEHI